EAADAVDPAGPLLHGRGGPTDAVVRDLSAEGVQVLAFLEDVRRHEDEREAGHAELLDEPLVDTAPHPADGNLTLEVVAEGSGELGQLVVRDARKVDRQEEVEGIGRV